MNLKEVLEEIRQIMKGEKPMSKTKQQKSYVTYVYGQIYRGYIESDKGTKFKITNIRVREWKRILNWLKKKEYIIDYKLGNELETACELEIEGFNGENLIYKNYLKGIDKNIAKEKQAA